MASSMPIPIPPRDPSPSPDEDNEALHAPTEGTSMHAYASNALSPLSMNFMPKMQYANLGSLSPPKASLRAPPALSPSSTLSPYSPMFSEHSDSLSVAGSEGARNPFNFQTQHYAPGRPAQIKADIGRRRGHKYKHSSVSHQIFLEPAPRTPLPLPSSLPIPTFAEFRHSMSSEQRLRLLWCCVHLLVAAYVQWSGHGSLAMTALSHLLFFDALGAFLCVAVDVGGNFEVWKRSSIRYPFGLERAEVLAGLAMSIGLLFMGLDLVSHNLQHSLENAGGHEAHHKSHHPHHERVPAGSVDTASLAAIVATLVSASALGNHERIGRTMQLNLPLPSVLSNPTHLLTLSCSTLLLLLPLLSFKSYKYLDAVMSAAIALLMGALGTYMCYSLGKMLLMSYCGPDGGAGSVVAEIEQDGAVDGVEEARFWQVHYGLCMANLKVRLKRPLGGRSLDEEMSRVRDRISSLVRNRLAGGYGGGRGGTKWEVSTQIMLAGGAVANGHVHGHGHSH